MANGDGSKRERKNMNLSLSTFKRLEVMKAQEERKIKLPLPWDNFFIRLLDEVKELRRQPDKEVPT